MTTFNSADTMQKEMRVYPASHPSAMNNGTRKQFSSFANDGNDESKLFEIETRYKKESMARKNLGFYLRLMVLLIIANLLFIISTFAQLVTVGGVTVSNSTQITIKGGLQNNSGAAISNNGTIDITGDFTNNSGTGLFGASNGTVQLNGSAQNIGGSSVTQFNNLETAGTAAKTLQNDISVGGSNG